MRLHVSSLAQAEAQKARCWALNSGHTSHHHRQQSADTGRSEKHGCGDGEAVAFAVIVPKTSRNSSRLGDGFAAGRVIGGFSFSLN